MDFRYKIDFTYTDGSKETAYYTNKDFFRNVCDLLGYCNTHKMFVGDKVLSDVLVSYNETGNPIKYNIKSFDGKVKKTIEANEYIRQECTECNDKHKIAENLVIDLTDELFKNNGIIDTTLKHTINDKKEVLEYGWGKNTAGEYKDLSVSVCRNSYLWGNLVHYDNRYSIKLNEMVSLAESECSLQTLKYAIRNTIATQLKELLNIDLKNDYIEPVSENDLELDEIDRDDINKDDFDKEI